MHLHHDQDPLEFSEYGRNPRWPLLLTIFLSAVASAGILAGLIYEASRLLT